jgi:hypothetical protein
MVNAVLFILLGVSFMGREKLPIPLKHAIALYGPSILVALNVMWIWETKPDPVSLQYWLPPLVLAFANVALCFGIDWESVRLRIMADKPITRSLLGQ